MKKLYSSFVWKLIVLIRLGFYVGSMTLLLSAYSYPTIDPAAMLGSYHTENPLILPINAILPCLLMLCGYFLSCRGWVGYLFGALPTLAIGLVNYFKISLRSDPLLASDLLLVAEAGGILNNYELEFAPVLHEVGIYFLIGLLIAWLLIPKGNLKWQERSLGVLSSLAVFMVIMNTIFLNDAIYQKMENKAYIDEWSDTEVFVSRGVVYSFLHSAKDMIPQKPEGYRAEVAQQALNAWEDVDIPEDKKVSVMGIMLEAFCDLTDYEVFAAQPGVMEVYAPWHALEKQSVSGDLLTNIFAGGTVNSEWGFLTGYTSHDTFRTKTDSYVWYLRNQGYYTTFDHPGNGWFYNRQNVNGYLGFEQQRFTEQYYGTLVDPIDAIWNSDHILMPELVSQLKEHIKQGPCFSFAVSYQNHGPYEYGWNDGPDYVTGLDEQSNNIFNNYLHGIKKTLTALCGLVDELEAMPEPVVLVLFGDHKPWAGNGNSAYTAAGITFDLSTLEGFKEYYATPYLIWANSAAKETLQQEFVGEGGDFSPCFLMPEVFDQCGWTGSGFMQFSREIRAMTPLVHEKNLYLVDGVLTSILPEAEQEEMNTFLCAQYAREHERSLMKNTVSSETTRRNSIE